MNSLRRVPLLVVLAVVLIVVGVLSSTSKSVDPSQLPNAPALNASAESTSLFCTGLSADKLGASGRVIFLNTTDQSHQIAIQDESSSTGVVAMTLRPYQQYGFDPSANDGADYLGVDTQVTGGGVVGIEVTKNHTSEAPCISTGVTNWFGAGFDTTVGSTAVLNVFNPTATPAVFNVSTYSASGYDAPTKFQGVAVSPYSQVEINLGEEIVDMSDIGVHLRVLRGTLDIVGTQQSGPTTSLNTGVTRASTSAIFPLVTTANNANAQIRFSNPGPTAANVTLHVTLARYRVPDQTLSVPAFGSAIATITPNPAIPAAGYATVAMDSSTPVIAALATGTGRYVALSTPGSPQSEFLVGDFTGRSLDAAAVTNTSSKAITITVNTLANTQGAKLNNVSFHLNANTTESLRTALPTLTSLKGVVMIVKSSRPSMLVTLTLPTTPAGLAVVPALDGR
jgi:hypothetical protein